MGIAQGFDTQQKKDTLADMVEKKCKDGIKDFGAHELPHEFHATKESSTETMSGENISTNYDDPYFTNDRLQLIENKFTKYVTQDLDVNKNVITPIPVLNSSVLVKRDENFDVQVAKPLNQKDSTDVLLSLTLREFLQYVKEISDANEHDLHV